MAKLFFENKFILTRKLHKEYCKATFHLTRKRQKALAFILSALCLALALVFLFVLKIRLGILIAGIFAAYFFYMGIWGYTFYEWIDMGRLKDEFGPAVVMVVSFFSDRVALRVNEKHLAFKYSSITTSLETENLIILLVNAEGIIEHGQAIYKKAFEKEEDILAFKKYINDKTGKAIFTLESDENKKE